jgi:hypothetical protein
MLLFAASVTAGNCGRWWAPLSLSLAASLALAAAVQLRVCAYWRRGRRVAAEGEEGGDGGEGDAYGHIYGPSNNGEYFCGAPSKVRHRMS